jgi:hypothetical protein
MLPTISARDVRGTCEASWTTMIQTYRCWWRWRGPLRQPSPDLRRTMWRAQMTTAQGSIATPPVRPPTTVMQRKTLVVTRSWLQLHSSGLSQSPWPLQEEGPNQPTLLVRETRPVPVTMSRLRALVTAAGDPESTYQ